MKLPSLQTRVFSALFRRAAPAVISLVFIASLGCGGNQEASEAPAGPVSLSLKLSLEIPEADPTALKGQEPAPCSLSCQGKILPMGQGFECAGQVSCEGSSELSCEIPLAAGECSSLEATALFCEVKAPDDSVLGVYTAVIVPFEVGNGGRVSAGASLNASPSETTAEGFFGVFETLRTDPAEGQRLLESVCQDCGEADFEDYCLSICTFPVTLSENHCTDLGGFTEGCPSLCPAVASFQECLNGVVEAGEQCDPRTELGKLVCSRAKGVCTADCDCILGGDFGEPPAAPPSCGDHVLDPGEECEADIGPDGGSLCESSFCVAVGAPPGPRGETPCTCVAPLCIVNGVCERYETLECVDCQVTPGCFTGPGFCGNERCDEGESGETCALDCEAFCGLSSTCDDDGVCEVCETARNCADCAHCGDLVCDLGEEGGCPQDCCLDCMTCGNGRCEGVEYFPPDENFPNPNYCPEDCGENHCGNGAPEYALGESCDDGNTAAGDGCDASCQLEACGDGCCRKEIENRINCGMDCSRGDGSCAVPQETPLNSPEDCSPCPVEPCCGNGAVDPGEACDYGIPCANPDDLCQTGFEGADCSCIPQEGPLPEPIRSL